MNDADFEAAMQTFLEEQPHWLERDVKYIHSGEPGIEPEMGLSIEAMKGFVRWLLAHGLVPNPELAWDYMESLIRRQKAEGGGEATE